MVNILRIIDTKEKDEEPMSILDNINLIIRGMVEVTGISKDKIKKLIFKLKAYGCLDKG